MVYRSEKLLIKISAILAIINLILLIVFGFVFESLKSRPEFVGFLGRYGMNIPINIFEFSYIIMLVLRIVIIIILFMIANKLDKGNSSTIAIVSIILGIVCFKWLLGYLSSVLLIIAGIMIFINSNK